MPVNDSEFLIRIEGPGAPWVVPALLVVIGVFILAEALHAARRHGRVAAPRVLVAAALIVAVAYAAALRGGIIVHPAAWPAVCLLAVLLVRAAGAYRRTPSPIPPMRRAVLSGLRAAAVAALGLLMLKPVVESTRTWHEQPALAILLDASRSMEIRDATDPESGALRSRRDSANEAIAANWERIERLSRDHPLVAMQFGGGVRDLTAPDGKPWSIQADQDVTDLGAALAHVADRRFEAGLPIGAVVLLSDGAHNLTAGSEPLAAAESLGAARTALFAIGVGSEKPMGETRSVVPLTLTVPAHATLDARVPVAADFDCLGWAGVDIQFELAWDGEVFHRTSVRPVEDRQSIRVEGDVLARPAGFHVVEARARPRDPDWRGEPAALSRFVRVTEETIQILYIEAKPRSESAFIARAIAGEERFRLTRAMVGRPVEGAWASELPRRAEDWNAFHVIVLGDLRRGDLSTQQITAIRAAVDRRGTGLAILGGLDNVGVEGLAATRLTDVLPVEGGGTLIEGPVRLRPTAAGLRHPIGRITDDDEVEAAWERLPPMSGATLLGKPKPTAEVLAVDRQNRPMLVVGTVGQGRTLVMATDTTWRWVMHSDDGGALHRRFWRQVMFWLANRRPLVQVAVDRPRYDLAETRPGSRGVPVEAFVLDGLTGRPLADAQVELSIRGPQGSVSPLAAAPAQGKWTARAFAQAVGAYNVRLVARQGTQVIGEGEARFMVESVDLERRAPLANLALLRRLAEATSAAGGAYADIDRLGDVLNTLAKMDLRRPRRETLRRDVAAQWRWPAAAIICSLLALEWAGRKRSGLV